jgi:hypothetical protein
MLGEDPQGAVHKIFNSYKTYKNSDEDEDDNDSDEEHEEDESIDKSRIKKIRLSYEDRIKQKQFTENVMMAMAKAIRNLGLARDAHVSSLKYRMIMYQREKNYLKNVSSFSVADKDSVLAKIIPFLGGGSALTLIGTTATGDDSSPDIAGRIPSIPELLAGQNLPFGLPIEYMLFLFIASGFAIMTVVTLILKARNKRYLNRNEKSLNNWAKGHWENKIRPSMSDCLFQLYKDLRFSMNIFYPDSYKEDDFSDDTRARKTIEEEIMVPKSIEPANEFIIKEEDDNDNDDDNDDDS